MAKYLEAVELSAYLADALKAAEQTLAERGVELKEITRALARYSAFLDREGD